jgi:hypothetical protein
MKHNILVVGLALSLAARTSLAQPSPGPEAPAPTPTPPAPPAPAPAPTPPAPTPPAPTPAPTPPVSSEFEDEPVTLTPTPAPKPGSKPAPADGHDHRPTTLDELTVPAQRQRLEINLFGAMQLRFSSEEHYDDFALGPLGFVASGRMSPTLTALSEFVMETTDTGEAVVDLERVVLRWTHDRFAVSAGRTHTDFGYWNNAYHHGTWLQPTADRPLTLRFEDDGGLLPVHWIGVWGEYRHPVGKGNLRTLLAIGNGRGANVDDLRVASDVNAAKSINVNVSLDNVLSPGTRVGGSVLLDRIAAQPVDVRPALPDERITELIGSLFVSHRGDTWTLIGEGYYVAHDAPSDFAAALFGFGLLAYSYERYTPYVLVEARKSFGGVDPFFVPDPAAGVSVPNFGSLNAGVRFELSTWSSLKLEGSVARSEGETVAEGIVDWAFGL